MIQSMTGFGRRETQIMPFGKICVELRSSNHKFLDTVLHLPIGFLSLEDRIKKEIEAKIKRGRVTCVINIIGGHSPAVFINKEILKNYISEIKNIKGQFRIKDEVSINTLVHLPGVVSSRESIIADSRIWPGLKNLVNQARDDLIGMRKKEGKALYVYLKERTLALKTDLATIKIRFKKAIKEKLAHLKTEDERTAFLKDRDITEEVERLSFHISNFIRTLTKNDAVGKELDFIAQEMQREANTIGAKSCDTFISAQVIQIKSKIEKLREQLQNIE